MPLKDCRHPYSGGSRWWLGSDRDCNDCLCHWSERLHGFLFLAYFMSVVLKSLEITMVTYAIFGVLIALIFVQSQKGKLAPAAETNTSNASFDEDDYDDGF